MKPLGAMVTTLLFLVVSLRAADAPLQLTAFSEGVGRPLVMLGGGTLGAAEFEPHAHVLASSFRDR